MFTEKDKLLIKSKGMTETQVEAQLNRFKTGFPYIKLAAAATRDKGIAHYGESERTSYAALWDSALSAPGFTATKFVPASGAASRMFRDLYAFISSPREEPKTDFEKKFFSNISYFAFHDQLNAACLQVHGMDIAALEKSGRYKDIARTLLGTPGLGYGNKPKGLLPFHSYPQGPRTAVEEHLHEASLVATDAEGCVRVHFTVPHSSRADFEALLSSCLPELQAQTGKKFIVTLSEQKPQTDTIAATPDGEPFRDADGNLLFRPGGHGALVENLNDIDSDVIFIKNIDNVVPERSAADVAGYEKMLAGKLVEVKRRLSTFLTELDDGLPSPDELHVMKTYLESELCTSCSAVEGYDNLQLADYLYCKFNRPLRVCAMVRNVGEAGGGPFLAYNADGSISPQILESSQINMDDPQSLRLFESGAYFNPVDMVCSTKNYKGEKFNLTEYVDKEAGFISSKSKNGKELKALELPGLWNGGMSDWNTVFVEVPLSTFNPVKTVADLLRLQHQ